MSSTLPEANLGLVEPSRTLREEFLSFCDELKNEGMNHGIGSMDPDHFDRSLKASRDHALGIRLREGWVPSDTFWLIKDGRRILGTINLRHALTPFLEAEGGHIGYAVRPSERRKGYATHMLRQCLKVAPSRGLRRVLVTCDDNNIASARVIEKAGGQLFDTLPSLTRPASLMRRCWLDVALAQNP